MRTLVSIAASAALSFALFSPALADTPPPPTCTAADHALHFDGKRWSCDAIPGLLLAHAAYVVDRSGMVTCDNNAWGGATCAVSKKNNVQSATLTCPAGTSRVDQMSIDGVRVPGTSAIAATALYHAYCYSKFR